MLGMLFSDIFDAKVVYNKDGHDGSPFVLPEVRGGGCFIIPSFVEVGAKEIIHQCSTLPETLSTSDNFKVDPTIVCVVGEIVLIKKTLWDI